MAAHLEQYVLRYHKSELAQGRSRTPVAELRSQREQELEPVQVDATRDFGLHLGQEILKLVQTSIEAVRWDEEWWEIAVAILLLVDLHCPLEDLGISQGLIEREWRKPGSGEDLFGHREGLLDYAFVNPEHREDERARWERMWLLGARAATLLGGTLAAAPPARADSPQMPTPLTSEFDRKSRRNTGRPRLNTEAQDKQIAERWATKHFARHADLGREMQLTKKQIHDALERHRKRRKNPRKTNESR